MGLAWCLYILHPTLQSGHEVHQRSFSINTRNNSTHRHHQMVNTKIRLIISLAAKDEEALYSQQKQDQELTLAHIMKTLLQNSDLT